MATFIYRAKKGPDEILEGGTEADSESAAVRRLMQSGLYPIWVKEKTSISDSKRQAISFSSKKVKTKDLANFTRQLSELLDSGLALYNCLNIIENQIEAARLKEVINGIRDSVRDGNTFSDSLKTYPRIFSNLYVNLIKSGEAAGILGESLSNVADFLDKEEDIRSRIVSAMAYPGLMMIVGIATIFVLTAFVVPRMASMFIEMGQILPLPTRLLIGISDFAQRFWILLLIFAAGFIFFIKRSKSNKTAKKAIDRIRLKLPVIGRLTKSTELARFSGTLSTLLKNGVPILNALKVTSDIMENGIIKEEVARIYDDVKTGSSLAAAIKKDSTFGQFVVNMTAIGEEGGILDKTLSKVARSFEIELERSIKLMSSLLEPIIILIMGLLVGFVVIAMLLPVFQISLVAH